MSSGFQQQVYGQQAQAIAGDFASSNPRSTYDAGPGGLVAGTLGVTIGRFAWVTNPVDPNSTPKIASNAGAGPVAGFVHREQQGLNTTYLSPSGMAIPKGFPVVLHTAGDFWAVNDGATQALVGQKAFANVTSGAVAFAAAGGSIATASGFTASVAASTFSVTGSIDGDIMTVTAVGSGTIVAGATISGTGVASGTKVVSQISGTAGGIGTYYVSIPGQSAASTTISGTYGTMTVTAAGTGLLAVGQVLSGTGVVAGTKLTQFLTGLGGTGTYAVDNNTVVASTADVAGTSWVETKWYAVSAAAAGGLVKISSWVLG